MVSLAFALVFAVHELLPIPLIGFSGSGHACPTEEAIYTARHVVEKGPLSSPYGGTTTLWIDNTRDIAAISVGQPTLRFRVVKSVQEQEKVHWYEFNFTNKKKMFVQEKQEARVLRSVSGHIIFDKGPVSGSSGSCLLNESNEVVGIVVWHFPVKGTEKTVGVAIDITGVWKP